MTETTVSVESRNNAGEEHCAQGSPNATVRVPVYSTLKDLRLQTSIVSGGVPVVTIVAPAEGSAQSFARAIQAAIEKVTGVQVPTVVDSDPHAVVPFTGNLILLGNRSTNRVIRSLYDLHYTLLDLRYPGIGGFEVRTLHDPFGNGANAIFIGASDDCGLKGGVEAFIQVLSSTTARPGSLSIGPLMKIALGEGMLPPTELVDCENWSASRGYGSRWFGWNSISTRMALYYMTGDEFHAREVIRLAFPDEHAIEEFEQLDGERIQNKRDPIAGPYHYSAHLLVLYWDLIEERPVFSDEERLRMTNALARQLTECRGLETILSLQGRVEKVGSRHEMWSAITLFCLSRYFARSYPQPVWPQGIKGARSFFEPLGRPRTWVVGESQDLDWYSTGIAPILTYLLLSGERTPVANGVVAEMLRSLEVLISGRAADAALECAAIDFLHMAAYLTGDGRWLCYRERTGVTTAIFRIGQSFWPEPHIAPVDPSDLVGKWTIQCPHPLQWKKRDSGIPLEQSFEFASYRSAADDHGDFVLLKGVNGGRAEYHSAAVWELRLGGQTILTGAANQAFLRVGGIVPSRVSTDGALKRADVLGNCAFAVTEVMQAGYGRWQRTLIVHDCAYALFLDEMTSDVDDDAGEFVLQWQFETADIALQPPLAVYDGFVCAMEGAKLTATLRDSVRKDERRCLISLLLRGGRNGRVKELAANAAMLHVPEPALVVAGFRGRTSARIACISCDCIFALDALIIEGETILYSSDKPADINWDLRRGELYIRVTSQTHVQLALTPRKLVVDGIEMRPVINADGMAVLRLTAGPHLISGARLSTIQIEAIKAHLTSVDWTSATKAKVARTPSKEVSELPPLKYISTTALPGMANEVIAFSLAGRTCMAVAISDTIHLVTSEGSIYRSFTTDARVQKIHRWPEHRLLIAGCADEKVIAFDEQGQRRWEFISEMDPALLSWGKTYWYKTAPGQNGIHGLGSGIFVGDENQLFVGSTCTLEILNYKGALHKRLPVFWGLPTTFCIVPGPQGSRNLLIGRRHNGYNRVPVINNRALDATPRGFHDVPPGATYIDGWSSINRNYLFYEDLAGHGEKVVIGDVNGVWNRVQIWDVNKTGELRYFQNEMEAGVLDRDVAGYPLFDVSFGPGSSYWIDKGDFSRKNVRDLIIADIDGDGVKEIIVALWTGHVIAFNYQLQKRWSIRLPHAPAALGVIERSLPANRSCVIACCDDGEVILIDARGVGVRRGRVPGRPIAVHPLSDSSEGQPIFMVATNDGHLVRFAIPEFNS